MTGARDSVRTQCPDCGVATTERDPLMSWWRCDDCALAIDSDGTRVA